MKKHEKTQKKTFFLKLNVKNSHSSLAVTRKQSQKTGRNSYSSNCKN